MSLTATVLAAQAQTLKITGAVKQPLTLSAEDLAAMPRASVTTTTADKAETRYEGVFLHEILKKAGVPQGEQLRGKALTTYVLAKAQDGYEVLFSLGELDPIFIDNQVLVADSANGKALLGRDGRFRLVLPKDKSGPRNVRMLTSLEVVQVEK